MRNSSLVKRFCADNSTGLKPATDATSRTGNRSAVGEHSALDRRQTARTADEAEEIMPARVAINQVKNLVAESLRFPGEG